MTIISWQSSAIQNGADAIGLPVYAQTEYEDADSAGTAKVLTFETFGEVPLSSVREHAFWANPIGSSCSCNHYAHRADDLGKCQRGRYMQARQSLAMWSTDIPYGVYIASILTCSSIMPNPTP